MLDTEIKIFWGGRNRKRKLTTRQQQILTFIKRVIKTTGQSPTHREIADQFNITLAPAQKHVKRLFLEGYVGILPNESRGLFIREFFPKNLWSKRCCVCGRFLPYFEGRGKKRKGVKPKICTRKECHLAWSSARCKYEEPTARAIGIELYKLRKDIKAVEKSGE